MNKILFFRLLGVFLMGIIHKYDLTIQMLSYNFTDIL